MENNPLHHAKLLRINSISLAGDEGLTIIDLENQMSDKADVSEADENVLLEKWVADNAISKSNVKGPMVLKGNGCTYHVIKFDNANQTQFIFLLFDWMKLWNCFSQCSHDALQEQVPLLAATVKFFLKGNVLVLSIILNLYMAVLCTINSQVFKTTTLMSTYTQIALILCALIGYGSVKGYSATKMTPEALKLNNIEVDCKGFLSIAYTEMKKIFLFLYNGGSSHVQIGANKKDDPKPVFEHQETYSKGDQTKELQAIYRKLRKFGVTRVDGYLDICNMATYYLNTLKSDSFAFKPRIYTQMFLLIFIAVVPIGILSQTVSAWIETVGCIHHNHTTFYGSDQYCNNALSFTIFSLGGAVSFVSAELIYMQLICIFAVLIYGSDISFALTKYWMLRFFALRKISACEKDGADDANISVKEDGDERDGQQQQSFFGGQLKKQEFFESIKRDAFERYLIVNNIFDQTSQIWSFTLLCFLVACAGLSIQAYISFLYYYFQEGFVSFQSIAW